MWSGFYIAGISASHIKRPIILTKLSIIGLL